MFPKAFICCVPFASISIQNTNPNVFLSKEANGLQEPCQLQWNIQPPTFHFLETPPGWLWYQSSSPHLFYPSCRQWKPFFVSHSCLLLLTCSMNLSPYRDDEKWIACICGLFEVCGGRSTHITNGPSVKWHYQWCWFPHHVLLLLEYRDMITKDRPFHFPFQHKYEPKHFAWSILFPPPNSLLEFLECALFHLFPCNLFCSGTAFILFHLRPRRNSWHLTINIFCSCLNFHSTPKSIVWHPPAAKTPWAKRNWPEEWTCYTREGWMDTNWFQWVIKHGLSSCSSARAKQSFRKKELPEQGICFCWTFVFGVILTPAEQFKPHIVQCKKNVWRAHKCFLKSTLVGLTMMSSGDHKFHDNFWN